MSYNDWKDGRLAGIEFAAKYFEGFIKSSLEPKQVATMLRAIIIIEEKLDWAFQREQILAEHSAPRESHPG